MTTPQVGHIVSRTIYAKVLRTVPLHAFGLEVELECMDLDRQTGFAVRGGSLIESFVSADTWGKEEQVSKTELARKLTEAGSLPFSVCFLKARGQERFLRGRLVAHEDLLGRSMVHDFDVEKGSPLREVDHRTILWLVLDGVKYTLKGK